MQYNFYPNDGECVKPTTNPPNEFSAGALGSDASKSWRFFLNQNSQACRGGVTTTGMITNGKIFGGVSNSNHIYIHSTNVSFQVLGISSCAQEMYGLCVNGFADVSERRHAARQLICCELLELHCCSDIVFQWGYSLFRLGSENLCNAV
jgi:hypothetical protein